MQRIYRAANLEAPCHGAERPTPKGGSRGPFRGLPLRRLSAEGAERCLRIRSLSGWQSGVACGSPSCQDLCSAESGGGPGGCGRQSGLTAELVDRTPGPSPGGGERFPESSISGSLEMLSAVGATWGSGECQYAGLPSVEAGPPRAWHDDVIAWVRRSAKRPSGRRRRATASYGHAVRDRGRRSLEHWSLDEAETARRRRVEARRTATSQVLGAHRHCVDLPQ